MWIHWSDNIVEILTKPVQRKIFIQLMMLLRITEEKEKLEIADSLQEDTWWKPTKFIKKLMNTYQWKINSLIEESKVTTKFND